MKYFLSFGLLLLIFFAGCKNATYEVLNDPDDFLIGIPVCGTPQALLDSMGLSEKEEIIKLDYPLLIYADEPSNFPRIQANDNLEPAGNLKGDILTVDLEVSWGDFYMEDESRPGLHMTAIGEKGETPTIPAPLIRVESGTTIRATFYNSLPDSTITVFGFQERPSDNLDSLFILPGESKRVEFKAGKPGTYLYWVQLGRRATKRRFTNEEEQLSGAFIIDPKGHVIDDRIIVMNIFSHKFLIENDSMMVFESLTMNGKSWPYSELMRPRVGDTIRWKVINASIRNHPMHLHGFYYDIRSLGGVLKDDIYEPEYRRTVITEFMTRRTTMEIEWVPSRPGRWLFHCHLSFHVNGEIRLPDGLDGEHGGHMAGLVTGIDVQPGPSDLIWKGEPREITLYLNEYEDDGDRPRNGFSLDKDFNAKPGEKSSPGPILILKQYQPTYVTVVNRMSEPTSIHWHGLELDSWADGVPEWSSSDGKTSPIIEPGKEFRYKLALMRQGSFIYHSHLDDVKQLTTGIYGPMIVIGEDETYDPVRDHVYIVGWKRTDPMSWGDLEINGSDSLPDIITKLNVTHRLRLMHIAPAGRKRLRIEKDGEIFPIRIVAKDGAEFPELQKVMIESSFRYGVGEAADFEFTPTSPGKYQLYIWNNNKDRFWVQDWIVEENDKIVSKL